MERFLTWLVGYSDSVIKPVDSLKKFAVWTAGAFAVGFAVAAAFMSWLSTQQPTETVELLTTVKTDLSCDVSLEIENARKSYSGHIEPMIERWLRLSEEAADTSLFPSQVELKTEAAERVRAEVQRTQGQHQKFLEVIASSCTS